MPDPSIKIYEPTRPIKTVSKLLFVSIAPQDGNALGAYAIAYPLGAGQPPEPDVMLRRRPGTKLFQGLISAPEGEFQVRFRADFPGANSTDPPLVIYETSGVFELPNALAVEPMMVPMSLTHFVEIVDPVSSATIIESEMMVEVEAKNGLVAGVYACWCAAAGPLREPDQPLTQVGITNFYNGPLSQPPVAFKVHVRVDFWADDPMDAFVVNYRTTGSIPAP